MTIQSQGVLYLVAAAAAAGFCIYGGVYLLGSHAASQDSYLELIAHGLGYYMIGKGIFVGAALVAKALQTAE